MTFDARAILLKNVGTKIAFQSPPSGVSFFIEKWISKFDGDKCRGTLEESIDTKESIGGCLDRMLRGEEKAEFGRITIELH